MNLHPNIYIYIYKLAAGAMIMIWITYTSQSIMSHQSQSYNCKDSHKSIAKVAVMKS